jgi:hypothetical protein
MPRHMSAGIPWWRVALLLTLCNWPVLGKTRAVADMRGDHEPSAAVIGVPEW